MTCPATHPCCQHRRDSDMRRYGCTCDLARADRARRQKKYRLRRLRGQRLLLDATGTRRRLQALQVLGWRQADLASRVGWHQQVICQLMHDRTFVIATTAAAVAELYHQLSETPGPSPITTQRAVNRGWLGPQWWDDDTIDDPTYTPPTKDRWGKDSVDRVLVEIAVAGRPLPRRLTRAERLLAVEQLALTDLSQSEIAERVGVPTRSVVRDLADLREQVAS